MHPSPNMKVLVKYDKNACKVCGTFNYMLNKKTQTYNKHTMDIQKEERNCSLVGGGLCL